jgi:hypothetical protein
MVNSDVREIRKLKIWDVISGPYAVEHPEFEGIHWNLCKVEVDNKIESKEFFFDSFNTAYEMVKYFHHNIDPIELEEEINEY